MVERTASHDGFGVSGIANTGGTAVRAITELDDAKAFAVIGFGVEPIAFHQRQARKVVRRKAVLLRELDDFVHHSLFVLGGDKAFFNRAVEGFFQNGVAALVYAGQQLELGGAVDSALSVRTTIYISVGVVSCRSYCAIGHLVLRQGQVQAV